MGKTRDVFKKIRDTKGTCHAKMGTIKDRNSRQQILKRLRRDGKNTQENSTKKDLNEQDYYDGVVSHPELDIRE